MDAAPGGAAKETMEGKTGMKDFDFDGHFSSIGRQVSRQLWVASITRLVWAIGCIGILAAFLWVVGHLAAAW